VYFYALLCSSDLNNYLIFSVEDIYHTSSTVTLDFSDDTVLLCLYKIYSWEKYVQVKNVREREFCKSCGKVKQLQQCNMYSSLEYTYHPGVFFQFLHKALIIMFICYLCKLYSGTVTMYLCVTQCQSSLIYILYTVCEVSLMPILFIYTIYKFIVIPYHSNKIINHYQLTCVLIWYLKCHIVIVVPVPCCNYYLLSSAIKRTTNECQ
jgi:hypothetical protein